MPTHKKGHDKDKYYHLAKDQGYRSRAAFKLIQINKRFDFLTKARVCIDLCAAPGGWCQVAAKIMPQGSIVLGVDLLPIRAIRGVKTLVADITTAECRRMIANELQSWKADVVLCDGAPNIGSSYSKDAYVQNELVLAALKTATDHLIQGGTFCSKIYRSVDYNALIWVLQQLFEDVQAIKPSSSRSQSSEIFIVCQKYTAPKYIDPKLLDPNHVFKEVVDPGLQKVDVLHKKYEQSNKRHRTGYSDDMGMLLQSRHTVSEFVATADPVRMLTDATELWFAPHTCARYETHAKTNDEVKECLRDLRVLSKGDFKKLLKWRQQLKDTFEPRKEASIDSDNDENAENKVETEAEKEERIGHEIEEIQMRAYAREKREKKKSRMEASKERQRQLLGITNNAFEVAAEEDLFSFFTAKKVTEGIDGVELPDLDPEDYQMSGSDDEEDEMYANAGKRRNELIVLEEALDDELDEAYNRYLTYRKDRTGLADNDNDNDRDMLLPSQKKKKLSRNSEAKLKARENEDSAIAALDVSENDENVDDGDDSEDDDGESVDEAPAVTAKAAAKADKWFSHPIFGESLLTGNANTSTNTNTNIGGTKRGRQPSQPSQLSRNDPEVTMEAAEAIASMPRTDKDLRSEKRKKEKDRKDRKDAKRVALSNALDEDGFGASASANVSVVKRTVSDGGEAGDGDDGDKPVDAKTLKYREMIKQGMGSAGAPGDTDIDGAVDVVPSGSVLYPEVHDQRSYDSDNENYDTHDRVMTLALGTLMLNKTKQKAFVDASYNRYAWNDAKDLPSWFTDDEARFNKPEVPVPHALVDQIKNRFQTTGTKEIKKVAEARMRKRKRAVAKLKAAKKKATTMAENSEMSERQKVKAIQAALKQAKVSKPGKVYVVAKKTKVGSVGSMVGSGKGKLKFVDKRMRKEQRAAKRREKGGKKRKH